MNGADPLAQSIRPPRRCQLTGSSPPDAGIGADSEGEGVVLETAVEKGRFWWSSKPQWWGFPVVQAKSLDTQLRQKLVAQRERERGSGGEIGRYGIPGRGEEVVGMRGKSDSSDGVVERALHHQPAAAALFVHPPDTLSVCVCVCVKESERCWRSNAWDSSNAWDRGPLARSGARVSI